MVVQGIDGPEDAKLLAGITAQSMKRSICKITKYQAGGTRGKSGSDRQLVHCGRA